MKYIVLLLSLGLTTSVWSQSQVDQLTAKGKARIEAGKSAQQKIEKIDDAAADILSDYKTEMKVVDGLVVYNNLLQKQLDNQETKMSNLQGSITEVAVIERQIVPLMIRMVDSLDDFIKLDVPFLMEERTKRVARLNEILELADVTASEKFRRVIEAYQIENEYGRTLETYKGSLQSNGKTIEVDFLRVGRVALVYQTASGDESGVWDQEGRKWEALSPAEYQKSIRKGLEVAAKQTAPDLIVLPISAPRSAK